MRTIRNFFRSLLIASVLVVVWYITDKVLHHATADYWMIFCVACAASLMALDAYCGGKSEVGA